MPGQLYLPEDQYGMFKHFVFKRYGMRVPEIATMETEAAFEVVRNGLIGTYINRRHLSFETWDYDQGGNLVKGVVVEREADGEAAFHQVAFHRASLVVDTLKTEQLEDGVDITIEIPRAPGVIRKLRGLPDVNRSITVIPYQPDMATDSTRPTDA